MVESIFVFQHIADFGKHIGISLRKRTKQFHQFIGFGAMGIDFRSVTSRVYSDGLNLLGLGSF